jgi:hypothetical protein
MAANRGHRHRLVLYTYMLNRWWRATLFLGCILLALVAALVWLPALLPQFTFPKVNGVLLGLAGGMGGVSVLLSIFLYAIRKSAYVQPYDNHLRLVTPFMQMKISYRRFVQASSTDMGRLFPLENLKGRKRDFIRPIAGETAVVLQLKGWPMPRRVLELFLSPYFFPDNTSRLALLVPDWIRFSTELESFRGSWLDSMKRPDGDARSDLLASFSEKR